MSESFYSDELGIFLMKIDGFFRLIRIDISQPKIMEEVTLDKCFNRDFNVEIII